MTVFDDRRDSSWLESWLVGEDEPLADRMDDPVSLLNVLVAGSRREAA